MKLVFAEIMHELKVCGYQVSARLLSAAHYGVPQARERLIEGTSLVLATRFSA